MSIICAARNCPTDSPDSAPMRRGDGSGMWGAGTFVTIACYDSPSHGWRNSMCAHVGCAQQIAPALLDVESWQDESILTQTDDGRTAVSTRDIQGLYCCRTTNCLKHVLDRKGSADAKRILQLAQQDPLQARQTLEALHLDYEAQRQLETVLAPQQSKPQTATPRIPQSPSAFKRGRATTGSAQRSTRVNWSTPLVGAVIGVLVGRTFSQGYVWLAFVTLLVTIAAKIRGWPGGAQPHGFLASLLRTLITISAMGAVVFFGMSVFGHQAFGWWPTWPLAGAAVWMLFAWLWPR